MTTAMQTAGSLGAKQISDSWSVSSSAPLGGTYTLPGRRRCRRHRRPRLSRRRGRQLPGCVCRGHGRRRHIAQRGQQRAGRSRLRGVRVVAEQRLGRRLGLRREAEQTPVPVRRGCAGRAYADVSADADPSTGLKIYDSSNGGMAADGRDQPGDAADRRLLRDHGPERDHAAVGVHEQRAAQRSGIGLERQLRAEHLLHLQRGVGYDGPTGVGSISGAVVPGAPGIGGPSVGPGTNNTCTRGAT